MLPPMLDVVAGYLLHEGANTGSRFLSNDRVDQNIDGH